MYADDCNFGGRQIDIKIEAVLESELDVVSDWLTCIDRKPLLHIGKTELILFDSKSKLRSKANLSIELNVLLLNQTITSTWCGFRSMSDV